jgi:hypothetical protein
VNQSNAREKPLICETHHIIPKSLGGTNDKINLVYLTPREHFIAHALLTKMVIDKKHKRSMAYAFSRMKCSHNKQGYSRIGNGKLYDVMRSRLKDLYSGENNPFYGNKSLSGDKNPFYGKQHTKETRDHISKKLKGKMLGNKNPFYGKQHTPITKMIISEQQKEPVTIIFEDGTVRHYNKKGDIGQSLGISKAMGIQLCSIKRHLWSKYNIKEILYENNINQKGSV